MKRDKTYSRLQYISDGETLELQERNIRQALAFGANWIQLRWKKNKDEAFESFAKNVRVLCTKHQACFIINDHVDTAKKVEADGVHLGLDDMSVLDARRILGTNKIIGGTANTLDHVLSRTEENCDYIGLGPFRFTSTKQKLSPILGLDGYQEITDLLTKRNISAPPIYAIGGIRVNDISDLKEIGIHGVAVSGLINNDPKIIQTIQSKWL
ncbi:thiamine phosphate synthase [Sphingobacterium corticis]|uniref:Thiamine-phosphate synthase n=1 Tax=Sphingobacterium corticis TaxID=1812823 RepID=A0ABW5NLL7_9SPHI